MPRLFLAAVFLTGLAAPLALHPLSATAAEEKPAVSTSQKKGKATSEPKKSKKKSAVQEAAAPAPEPSPPPPPPPPPILPGSPPALGGHMGERLVYNIHWMGMPVGLAEMRLTPDGAGRYTLSASLDSSGPIRMVYPVRDRLTSRGTLLPWGFKPEHYEKDQLEGPRSRHSTYRFNQEKGSVEYHKDGTLVKVIEGMLPESGDPIAAFHTVRTRADLTTGNSFQVQMVDGEKRYLAKINVGEGKRLFTPLGWFQVLPVQPLVEASTLFRHEGNLTIWLTDDARRLPVRVEGKVKIGEVAADLVEYDDGRGGHAKMVATTDK